MAKNLSPAQRAELERKCWDLSQRLYSQRRIAAELGVSQSTVSATVRRLLARTLKRLEADVALVKAEQTLQITHLIDEAAQAWERSKRPKKKASKRTGGGAKGTGEQQLSEAQDRDGDVNFLHAIRGLMGDIRKIWGIEAPPPKADDNAHSFRDAVLEAEEADRDFERRQSQGPPPEPAADPSGPGA